VKVLFFLSSLPAFFVSANRGKEKPFENLIYPLKGLFKILIPYENPFFDLPVSPYTH
jgi:hypothetical protein